MQGVRGYWPAVEYVCIEVGEVGHKVIETHTEGLVEDEAQCPSFARVLTYGDDGPHEVGVFHVGFGDQKAMLDDVRIEALRFFYIQGSGDFVSRSK